MRLKNLINRIATTVNPWGLIGAALILLPILAFVTYEDLHRLNAAGKQQLLAKGAALIRSFEAGTRAGRMMRQWGNPHLQRLLEETALQPDIRYLMVTDVTGEILAHSNPEKIGTRYGSGLDLQRAIDTSLEIYRVLAAGNDPHVFEVYRKFSPDRGAGGMRGRHHGMMRSFWKKERHPPSGGSVLSENRDDRSDTDTFSNLIIFVGLDMTAVENTLAADTRHSLFMAAILLLVGIAGVTLLFMTHSYRIARTSLNRIASFSDSLVDNLPVGLISIDADGYIASVNPEAGRILGLAEGKPGRQTAMDALPPAIYQLLDGPKTGSREVEKELVISPEGAGPLPIAANASPWHDRKGILMGTLVLIRDLSEIRALRKEIARNQRLASLGSLAAGVAHEIRNPLSSIKGFATYFKERAGENRTDHETADIMISEVERLNRVVGQLLELARPVELVREPIRLEPFLASSLALVKARAAQKAIRMTIDAPDPGLVLTADTDRISQVLLNLYLNAIDAMQAGLGTLTVSVRESHGDSGLLIAVTDNGAGIKKDKLPHVFDPYYTGKSSGTGLGLAIVHNIMEAHGGSVSVESLPGLGTTFTLFFPETGKVATDD